MKSLETNRLILRAWQESDFKAVHTYASNIENITFMQWGPNSEDESHNFLKRMIEKYNADPFLEFAYAVILKETGNLIGGCGISKIAHHNEAMLGWILHRDYWKQGHGTELAHELIRFGFEELKIHRIRATCDSENYGSFRVMERNNMRREGHFIKNRNIRGQWRDEFLYAILDEEWDVQKEITY